MLLTRRWKEQHACTVNKVQPVMVAIMGTETEGAMNPVMQFGVVSCILFWHAMIEETSNGLVLVRNSGLPSRLGSSARNRPVSAEVAPAEVQRPWQVLAAPTASADARFRACFAWRLCALIDHTHTQADTAEKKKLAGRLICRRRQHLADLAFQFRFSDPWKFSTLGQGPTSRSPKNASAFFAVTSAVWRTDQPLQSPTS